MYNLSKMLNRTVGPFFIYKNQELEERKNQRSRKDEKLRGKKERLMIYWIDDLKNYPNIRLTRQMVQLLQKRRKETAFSGQFFRFQNLLIDGKSRIQLRREIKAWWRERFPALSSNGRRWIDNRSFCGMANIDRKLPI